MERVWIVSELFYPEETSTAYILTHIALELSKEFEVRVLAGPAGSGSPSYKRGKYGETDVEGRLRIERVSDTTLDNGRLSTRLLRSLWLGWKLSRALWKRARRGDRVLIVTNPASLLLAVSLIVKFKKIKLYTLVHDVFPENTVPAGILRSSRSPLYKATRRLFNAAYRKADVLIVLGRDMRAFMQEKLAGKKRVPAIEIIENWADTDMFGLPPSGPAQAGERNGKIEIQYAGNLGRVQGLQALIRLIGRTDNPSLHFSFWGDGAVRKNLEKYVSDHRLEQVTLHGPYSREQQRSVLGSCDLAIVTLADGMFGLGVPSKSYNIMAAGKPILFIGDLRSEVALMVRQHDVGYAFETGDAEGVLRFFRGLSAASVPQLREKGRKAARLARNEYSRAVQLGKFLALMRR